MPSETVWKQGMSLFDPNNFTGLDLDQLANSDLSGDSFNDMVNQMGDPVEEVERQTLIQSTQTDTRVRLRCMRDRETVVYGPNEPDNIMSILHETDGLLFPFTPSISVSQTTDYQAMSMVHTNSDVQSYSKTPSVTINVTGKFSVQNQREGKILLAYLHLLRTVSKMYFGEKDAKAGKAGMPPPVMVFSGYGNYMFNEIPVVVRGHSFTLDDTTDSVVINTAGGSARLPSLMTITIDLVVQQTPMRQRKEFSLDEFRTGALLRGSERNRTGWI